MGACAHSAAATFSFHPVKTLAAGEGLFSPGEVGCALALVVAAGLYSIWRETQLRQGA